MPRVIVPSSSLQRRLLLPIGIGCAAALALSYVAGLIFGMMQVRERGQSRGQMAARTVVYAAESIRNPADLQRLVTSIGGEESIAYIVALGGTPTRVIASTRSEWIGRECRDLPTSVNATSLTDAIQSQMHRSMENPNGMGIAYTEPLLASQSNSLLSQGAVQVCVDTRRIRSAVMSWAALAAGALLVISAAVFAGAWRLIDRRVLRQVQSLVSAIDNNTESMVFSNDEIATVARVFNDRRRESLVAQTQLVRMRVDAEAANRAKSAFLANMSHEIRTPLTAILGFTDLLREDGNITFAPEQRLQTLDTIKNAGKHLLTVINDILDLSKIEADKMTVERIDTPLAGVLHEVESLMRPRASGKGLALSTILATPVPEHVASDPTRLRQILMNLVGNAVKFTEEGGVTITAGVTELNGQSRLVIDIEDTGPGMTQEQAARLFQAFGQSDETMTRKFGGTGLGLTICRRLSALMGGDTKLLRTEPGKGSCFRLVLPLEAVVGSAMISHLDIVAVTSTTTSTSAPVKLTGQILLAEDGVDNQRLIAFHIRKAGAQVTIADNGRIALEMLEKAAADGTPFDLLLTDMQMPEMDGYTLARTLRKRGSTLAIVALTAHAMAEDRDKCFEAGCDDYATKPIDKAKLLATCAAWLGARGGVMATKRAA